MPLSTTSSSNGQEIAVIGMAGRFPGADDVHAFWANLVAGRESVGLPHAGTSTAAVRRVRAGGWLRGMDMFDAGFFQILPREADVMDPQQRLFLEACWLALEDAGYRPDASPGIVGVYGAVGANQYLHHLSAHTHLAKDVDAFQLKLGNDKDFLATRVAYKLGLSGPAVSVQTACSSSLVAIHEACMALQTYQCEMALAGGASLNLLQDEGYDFQTGGVLSPDGHCRPFDAAANGTVPGSGVGVVVLKRLEAALADGDDIYAVILGTAVNNDGSRKAGFTAPSVQGQLEVIQAAQQVAGIAPDEIDFIEAHGTGTNLGDPIEFEALAQAFRSNDGPLPSRTCRIGSVKANIGHLDVAAGVASFIKAVLSLHHRHFPRQINFGRGNDRIAWADGPFDVDVAGHGWEDADRRVACVSSFGIGGTNAHAVLAQAPLRDADEAAAQPSTQAVVLPVSAHHADVWHDTCMRLADALEGLDADGLAQASFVLRHGRRTHGLRCAPVARNGREAAMALRQEAGKPPVPRQPLAPDVALLLPGQGVPYLAMARRAHAGWPSFREALEARLEAANDAELSRTLRSILTDANRADETEQGLDHQGLGQVMLFLLECAFADLWQQAGLRPALLVGHSLGEYTAATLAGMYTVADMARVLRARGVAMAEGTVEGAMLAVAMPAPALHAALPGTLTVAVRNAAERFVVAGPKADVERFAAHLEAQRVPIAWVNRRFAFHSPLMAPALDPLRAALQALRPRPARRPFVTSGGRLVQPGEVLDAEHWLRHAVGMVDFAAMLDTACASQPVAFCEAMPGGTLAALARLSAQAAQRPILAASQRGEDDPCAGFLTGVAQAWQAGLPVDWRGVDTVQRRRRHLPGTVFKAERHWVGAMPGASTMMASAASKSTSTSTSASASSSAPPALQAPSASNETTAASTPANNASAPAVDKAAAWLPAWRSLPPSSPAALHAAPTVGGDWLVTDAHAALADQLVNALRTRGCRVVRLPFASLRARGAADTNPTEALSQAIAAALPNEGAPFGQAAWQVIHTFTPDAPMASAVEHVYEPFVALLRALHGLRGDAPMRVSVVGQGLARVFPGDALACTGSLLLGPVRAAGAEYKDLALQCIDVDAVTIDGAMPVLQAEIAACRPRTGMLAFRHGAGWIEAFERAADHSDEAWTTPAAVPPLALSDDQAVLITGAWGGIGLSMAEALIRRGARRLVLVGHRLPQEARSAAETHRIESTLDALRAQGAELHLVKADITDQDDVQRLRESVDAKGWRVGVLVHASGLPPSGLLSFPNDRTAARQLAVKVRGTHEVRQAFQDHGARLHLYCSSVTAELGGLGQSDYVAANAFLAQYAQAHDGRPGEGRHVALLWDTWRDVGMAARLRHDPAAAAHGQALAQALTQGLSTEAGQQALLDVLDHGHGPRVLITSTDWPSRLQAMRRRPDATATPESEAARMQVAEHSASELVERWHRQGTLMESHTLAQVERLPWLRDHEVMGRPILPAVAYLDMLAAVWEGLRPEADAGPLVVSRLAIERALVIMPGQALPVRARFSPAADGSWDIEVASWREGAWLRHAGGQARVLRGAIERDATLAVPADGALCIEGDGLYAQTAVQGYFRSLQRLALGTDSAAALLHAPDGSHRQRLCIPVLDGAVQSLIALGAHRSPSAASQAAYLPFAFDDVVVHGPVSRSAEARVRWTSGSWGQDEVLCGQVQLLDDAGRLLIDMGRVHLKRMNAAAASVDASAVAGDAPQGEEEQRLAEIFEGLLGIAAVPRHATFFELGADSLLVVRLVARIREVFGWEPPIQEVFAVASVAQLAVLVRDKRGQGEATASRPQAIVAVPRRPSAIVDLLADDA